MKINKTTTLAQSLSLGGLMLAGSVLAQENKLYLFNWAEYMDPEIIEAFGEKYDVDVVQNSFSSLPEMLAKLNAGGVSQYAIIVPSNDYVPRLIQTGQVQKLDKSKLDNLDNIMEQFQGPAFDPGAEYSAPYQWGTTSIVYNTETCPDAPKSWSLLFDPQVNPAHPFAMMGDGQVSMGGACAYPGHGYDCTDMAHKFLDFILDAEVGAQLSNYNYYVSPNAAAGPYLDEVLTEPPVQPSEDDMQRLRFTPSLEGDALQIFQQL